MMRSCGVGFIGYDKAIKLIFVLLIARATVRLHNRLGWMRARCRHHRRKHDVGVGVGVGVVVVVVSPPDTDRLLPCKNISAHQTWSGASSVASPFSWDAAGAIPVGIIGRHCR